MGEKGKYVKKQKILLLMKIFPVLPPGYFISEGRLAFTAEE